MAVIKAPSITAFETVPKTMNTPLTQGGRLREIVETKAVAAADNDADVFVFMPVHSSWRLSELLVLNDAITAGTDYNIGLYTSASTPVDVDENLFADALSMASARVAPLDVLHQTLDINKGKQAIWEMLTLTADPHVWYYLCLTAITVGTAAGDITLKVRYVDGT